MTAQIISLAEYRNRHNVTVEVEADADRAAREFGASLMPVIVRTAVAPTAQSTPREATIVTATAALSAACRDMATNLATLMSHAEAACHSIGHIGDTADALIRTGDELRQAAHSFKQDHDRMSSELSSAGSTGSTP